jgi:hypothetical protein
MLTEVPVHGIKEVLGFGSRRESAIVLVSRFDGTSTRAAVSGPVESVAERAGRQRRRGRWQGAKVTVGVTLGVRSVILR